MGASSERIVFFDLETGGLDPLRHPIIQIALVAVDGAWREIEALELKIHFDRATCEASALEVNRWDPEVWKREAVSSPSALAAVTSFFRRHATVTKTARASGRPFLVARVAGHNAERFDCPFLVEWFKQARQFCPAAAFEPLDTVSLARWASLGRQDAPKDHKLGTVAAWLGVGLTDAHDALADIRATVEVAKVLCGRLGIGWTP